MDITPTGIHLLTLCLSRMLRDGVAQDEVNRTMSAVGAVVPSDLLNVIGAAAREYARTEDEDAPTGIRLPFRTLVLDDLDPNLGAYHVTAGNGSDFLVYDGSGIVTEGKPRYLGSAVLSEEGDAWYGFPRRSGQRLQGTDLLDVARQIVYGARNGS